MAIFPYYSRYMTTLLFENPGAYAFVRGIPEYASIQGMILFYDTGDGSIVTADLKGLPSSKTIGGSRMFGIHIQEHHMGGIPPIPPLLENRGTAWEAFYTERFRIWEILGKTIVLHDGGDDFMSFPSSVLAPGAKIGCGVIRRSQSV